MITWHIDGLKLPGHQVPTEPLSHSTSSAGQREKKMWVDIRTGKSLTIYHHRQNRLCLGKINFLPINNRVGQWGLKTKLKTPSFQHPSSQAQLQSPFFCLFPSLPRRHRGLGLQSVQNVFSLPLLPLWAFSQNQHGAAPALLPPLKTWPHKPNTQIQLVSVSNLQNLHWSCQSSLLKLVEAINGHVRTQQPSCTDLVRPELCLQLHRYRWWQVPWSLHCSCVSLVVEGSLPQAASVPGALASISVLGANVIPDKQSCASQSQAGTGTVAKLWFFFPIKQGVN